MLDNLTALARGVCLVAALTVTAGRLEAQQGSARFDRPVTAAADQALFSQAVLGQANQARRRQGLAPLALDPRLTRAAADHAGNMARLATLGHVLPVRGQRDLRQRMDRLSVGYRNAAENIAQDKLFRLLGRPISKSSRGCAFTYGDTGEAVPVHSYASLAASTVGRWMASAKHRASLLSPRFRTAGGGVALDPGGAACGDLYVVMTFAG